MLLNNECSSIQDGIIGNTDSLMDCSLHARSVARQAASS